MGFRIGQRVMFRDSRLSGIVLRHSKTTFWVEVEPGWEIPAQAAELIGLSDEEKQTKKNKLPDKEEQDLISPHQNETKSTAAPFESTKVDSWEKKPAFPKIRNKSQQMVPKEIRLSRKEEKKSLYSKSTAGIYELDLHIPALYPRGAMPKPSEALECQLEHVRQFIDWACKNRCKEIILIHGVGEGKLKQAILESWGNRMWLDLEDAPYSMYGRGATRVRLRASMRDGYN